jgi:dTDP-glucose pyrophosphorylase
VTTVGLIPAAGYATRLQPLAFSKEVYRIRGRPVIDFMVERMRNAPCSEIRIVTRPDKQDVIEYAAENGATVITARPPSLAASLVAGMRGLSDEDTVVFGFPDSIWEPVDGFARVLEVLSQGWRVALGLFRADDLRRYEPVLFDAKGAVTGIEFKPERPSSSWLWGCAATSVAVLRGLEDREEPGIYFDSLARQGQVGAVRLSEGYLDMGTRGGLEEALSAPPR